ncbi:MAG: bifunctional diaminohydroxyphosphoribosylaminopyrimidine deaminase/5-amino-6-(5-phosphoribosylamino)uracil reductase RibD [Terrisporobacter sp.]|uniref:bifunctional diaminohydroxyphosphoribosylaminopyrimidine deaminase/5-amino-6-(5-phosphoribosylamino)uracil reductase RibD n=1 Tax=Terrisporobacter sp. TaxID=1965305 RepID=UPI002FC59D9B
MTDIEYMKRGIELAKGGMGFVNPNPMVGAVIVKDGEIIGEGYHEEYGQLHAERNAIANCKESLSGSTMYVTLEPCCHYGKTPPCTEAIIKSGIKKVVIGSVDPNLLVSGKGIEILRKNDIEVVENVLKEECDKLNEVFFHYIKTKIPYVVMKYAMTMDGKIATYNGKSKWITGEEARESVHRDRHKYSGIMIGIGTVLADNPMLNCRIENTKNPVRIICDTNLSMPLGSNIVNTANYIPTIIATCCEDKVKQDEYINKGCKVIPVPKKDNYIDLTILMSKLGEEKIDSILLEGGAALNWSALDSGIVNKVQTYIAPKIFGGVNAKSPVSGLGVENPEQSFYLKNKVITQIGEDILIESEVIQKCSQV